MMSHTVNCVELTLVIGTRVVKSSGATDGMFNTNNTRQPVDGLNVTNHFISLHIFIDIASMANQ